MERDKTIDIARGISMLLVLAGHLSCVPKPFKIFLLGFHMPLFFFLSGTVFSWKKHPKFRHFLKNKVIKLIVPYFLLGIVVIIRYEYNNIAGERNILIR
ncbi:MAG: acyltransferase family protein [Clostridia bacterium]|nr:acyltransferase family protein [Clostridia bacterium]